MARVTKVTTEELTGLHPKYVRFLIEYYKDNNAPRAAEAIGWSPDYGYAVLARDDVKAAIDALNARGMRQITVDAEWQLSELVDNHQLARQKGDLSASNRALDYIGKHKLVDSYATKKLDLVVATDEEMVKRIRAGRDRVRQAVTEIIPEGAGPSDDEDLTFL